MGRCDECAFPDYSSVQSTVFNGIAFIGNPNGGRPVRYKNNCLACGFPFQRSKYALYFTAKMQKSHMRHIFEESALLRTFPKIIDKI